MADISKVGRSAKISIGGKEVAEVDGWSLDPGRALQQKRYDEFLASMSSNGIISGSPVPSMQEKQQYEEFLAALQREGVSSNPYAAYNFASLQPSEPKESTLGPIIKKSAAVDRAAMVSANSVEMQIDDKTAKQVERAARLATLPASIGKTPGQAAQNWQHLNQWGSWVDRPGNQASRRDEMAMAAMQALVVAAVKTTSQDAIGDAMEQLVFSGQAERISDLAYFLADQMEAARRRADEAQATEVDSSGKPISKFAAAGASGNPVSRFAAAAAASAQAAQQFSAVSNIRTTQQFAEALLAGGPAIHSRGGSPNKPVP